METPSSPQNKGTLSSGVKIRDLLLGSLWVPILVPLIFYLNFGQIDSFAIGTTVFLEVMILCYALGFYLSKHKEYHSTIELKGDWIDKIGAFWLVVCGFGPLIGWVATQVITLTESNWRWPYGIRVFFTIVLPIATLLPLGRYLQNHNAILTIPIFLTITLLPILTGINSLSDLITGPTVQKVGSRNGKKDDSLTLILPRTKREVRPNSVIKISSQEGQNEYKR